MIEDKVEILFRQNRLLATLPDEEYQKLLPDLQLVKPALKEILSEQNQPITQIYFPLTLVASVINLFEDGTAVEIATVGKEGLVGLPAFLGSKQMPSRVFCQIVGQAACLEVAAFQAATQKPGPFRQVLERYTQALFSQIAQNAACNRQHSVETRCARWLLMTHDRVGADNFGLTQEFLAQMLGTRRAAVNEAATRLQKAGFIRYRRGSITIENRPGLESATCQCYWIITGEYKRLLG